MENIFKESLLTLTKSEKNAFTKFSRQFYSDFKQHEYAGFLDVIEDPELLDSQDKAFKLLISKSDQFDSQKWRDIQSKLHKMLRKYFVYDWLKENQNEAQLILIKALRERNLERSFIRQCSQLEEKGSIRFR